MKRISAFVLVALIALPAFGGVDFAATRLIDLSVTSPASASTAIFPLSSGGLVDLGVYSRCAVVANLVGATGGVLDVYVQSTADGGTVWYDVIHFTQLTAGNAAVTYGAGVTRGSNATAPTTTGDAALAAGAIFPGGFGQFLRLKMVAGASTSAGAALVVKAYCSSL